MKDFKVEPTDTSTEEVQALRNQIADFKIKMNQSTGKHNVSRMPNQSHKLCYNCGKAWPHISVCPARDQVCRSCGKLHHFARVCRSRISNSSQQHRPLNFVDNQSARMPQEENQLFAVHHINIINSHDKLSKFKINIKIAGKFIPVLIDTGCSTNILNVETYQYLQKFEKCVLKKSRVSLIPYGSCAEDSNLTSLGIISCLAESNSRFAQDEFFVVDTKANNLIGGNLALRLNLLNVNVNQINRHQITSPPREFESRFSKVPPRLHIRVKQFEHVFTGTGKLKNEQVKLHIDTTVQPVAQKARRIPFHLRPLVDAELDKLRQSDIIEDITDEATPWVSPIVVLPKKSNPSEIRMCIDMRQANKAIERTRHPSPSIEDLIHDLNGATHFCKLDMNNAFLQLELDRDSRYITTFTTHQGLHRYKRLNFGTTSASEELQIKLERVLHNIKGCKNIADDIILFAKSQAELDNILSLILQRLSDHGLTLNLEKCEFDKQEVEFFGFVFSSQGISSSPAKVKAVQQMAAPNNISEIRSFLGMTNFLSRFIPDYAELSAPLRNLTKKEVQWTWGSEQQQSFKKLKSTLCSKYVMSYFTTSKETTIVTDAGPSGVSAILLQHSPNAEDYRVVSYSSRSLSDVERRYSQLEKECLAILHGCEKFNIYLAGSHFNILTDHKPLVSLLSNPNSVLPLRIERWCLRLQGYNYTVRHIKGTFNPADYCSRHSFVDVNSVVSIITEEYVNFIAKHATPNAVTLQDIQNYTKTDPTLQALVQLINRNTWYQLDETPQHFAQW